MFRRVHNLVRGARERCARLPNPAVVLAQARQPAVADPAILQVLRRDGVVVLPEHIRGAALERLRRAFAAMVAYIEQAPPAAEQQAPPPRTYVRFREYSVDRNQGFVEALDPFRYDAALLQAALDPTVIDLVSRYWGRRCMLSQAAGLRYEPRPATDVGSFGWHHDSLGKRASAMVLLTDVGPEGQHMTYIKGTHRRVHPPGKSLRNWTDAEVAEFAAPVRLDCTGKAGTVIVFDANGLHRGVRKPTTRRDVLVANYSAGHYVWRFVVPRANADALTAEQREFLLRNPEVQIVDEAPRRLA